MKMYNPFQKDTEWFNSRSLTDMPTKIKRHFSSKKDILGAIPNIKSFDKLLDEEMEKEKQSIENILRENERIRDEGESHIENDHISVHFGNIRQSISKYKKTITKSIFQRKARILGLGIQNVCEIALSPDETTFATVSEDRYNVRLWRRGYPYPLWVAYDLEGLQMGLSFHPKDNLLAAGGEGKIVRFYDVRTGNFKKSRDYKTDSTIHAISFNNNGTLMAVGTKKNGVLLIKWSKSEPLTQLKFLKQDGVSISQIKFGSGDQNILVYIAAGRYLRLLKTGNKEEINLGKVINAGKDTDYITGFDISSDDRLLAFGGWNARVIVLDISKNGKDFPVFFSAEDVHIDSVCTLKFTFDCKLLVTLGNGNDFCIWNLTLKDAEEIRNTCIFRKIKLDQEWLDNFYLFEITKDGDEIIVAYDEVVSYKLNDISDQSRFRYGGGHIYLPKKIEFSSDSSRTVSFSEKEIILFDFNKIDIVEINDNTDCSLSEGEGYLLFNLALSPVENILFAVFFDETRGLTVIKEFDSKTGAPSKKYFPYDFIEINNISCVTVSKNGKMLLVGLKDGSAIILNLRMIKRETTNADARAMRSENAKEGLINSSKKGEAEKKSDRSLKEYDSDGYCSENSENDEDSDSEEDEEMKLFLSERKVKYEKVHSAEIKCAIFCNEGYDFLSGGSDNMIFHVKCSKKNKGGLKSSHQSVIKNAFKIDHRAEIKQMILTSDSCFLISLDIEGQVLVSSFASRTLLHKFPLHADITSIGISADALKLFTSGKMIRVFDLDSKIELFHLDYKKNILLLAVSSDATKLATISSNFFIEVTDINLFDLPQNTYTPLQSALAPDSDSIRQIKLLDEKRIMISCKSEIYIALLDNAPTMDKVCDLGEMKIASSITLMAEGEKILAAMLVIDKNELEDESTDRFIFVLDLDFPDRKFFYSIDKKSVFRGVRFFDSSEKFILWSDSRICFSLGPRPNSEPVYFKDLGIKVIDSEWSLNLSTDFKKDSGIQSLKHCYNMIALGSNETIAVYALEKSPLNQRLERKFLSKREAEIKCIKIYKKGQDLKVIAVTLNFEVIIIDANSGVALRSVQLLEGREMTKVNIDFKGERLFCTDTQEKLLKIVSLSTFQSNHITLSGKSRINHILSPLNERACNKIFICYSDGQRTVEEFDINELKNYDDLLVVDKLFEKSDINELELVLESRMNIFFLLGFKYPFTLFHFMILFQKQEFFEAFSKLNLDKYSSLIYALLNAKDFLGLTPYQYCLQIDSYSAVENLLQLHLKLQPCRFMDSDSQFSVESLNIILDYFPHYLHPLFNMQFTQWKMRPHLKLSDKYLHDTFIFPFPSKFPSSQQIKNTCFIADLDEVKGQSFTCLTFLIDGLLEPRNSFIRKLPSILDMSDPVYESKGLEFLLEYKWRLFGRRLFLLNMFKYIFYCFLMVVNFVVVFPLRKSGKSINEIKEIYLYSIVLDYLLLIYFFFFIFVYEIIQLCEERLDYWRKNVWNKLDIGLIIISPAALILDLLDIYDILDDKYDFPIKFLNFAVILITWIRLTEALRGFPSTAALARLIENVFYDMKSFFLVVFFFLIGFALSSFILQENYTLHGTWEFLKAFYYLFIGDTSKFDELNKEIKNPIFSEMAFLILYTFTIFFIIIMLNLLISIISGTYSKVMSMENRAFQYERLKLLNEYEGLKTSNIFFKWITNSEAEQSREPTYLHMVESKKETITIQGESEEYRKMFLEKVDKVLEQLTSNSDFYRDINSSSLRNLNILFEKLCVRQDEFESRIYEKLGFKKGLENLNTTVIKAL